uniref:Uncharacterized protein n=1 Tax=Anguilla anguilla TaxID=7936 RepID=A0A0E9PHE9_ANGAN
MLPSRAKYSRGVISVYLRNTKIHQEGAALIINE